MSGLQFPPNADGRWKVSAATTTTNEDVTGDGLCELDNPELWERCANACDYGSGVPTCAMPLAIG